jgi:hypothetical protein
MHHPGPPRQIQQDNLTQNWKNQFIAQVLAPDAQTCRDKILQLLRLHCTYRLSPSIFWSNPLWKSGPLDSLHSLVVLFPELLQVVFQGPGTPEKAMILGPVVTQVYISTTEVFRSHANALSIIVKHLKTSPKLFRTYRLLPNIVFFFLICLASAANWVFWNADEPPLRSSGIENQSPESHISERMWGAKAVATFDRQTSYRPGKGTSMGQNIGVGT